MSASHFLHKENSIELPIDCLIAILLNLSGKDIVSVMSACKIFLEAGKNPALWENSFKLDFPFNTVDNVADTNWQELYKINYRNFFSQEAIAERNFQFQAKCSAGYVDKDLLEIISQDDIEKFKKVFSEPLKYQETIFWAKRLNNKTIILEAIKATKKKSVREETLFRIALHSPIKEILANQKQFSNYDLFSNAIAYGNLELVKYLYGRENDRPGFHNTKLDIHCNVINFNAFEKACELGHIEICQYFWHELLKQDSSTLTGMISNGISKLFYNHHLTIFRYFMDNNLLKYLSEGWQTNHTDTVNLLLENVVKSNSLFILKYLLKKYPDQQHSVHALLVALQLGNSAIYDYIMKINQKTQHYLLNRSLQAIFDSFEFSRPTELTTLSVNIIARFIFSYQLLLINAKENNNHNSFFQLWISPADINISLKVLQDLLEVLFNGKDSNELTIEMRQYLPPELIQVTACLDKLKINQRDFIDNFSGGESEEEEKSSEEKQIYSPGSKI